MNEQSLSKSTKKSNKDTTANSNTKSRKRIVKQSEKEEKKINSQQSLDKIESVCGKEESSVIEGETKECSSYKKEEVNGRVTRLRAARNGVK